MSLALGRNRSDEYRPGLRKIARRLQGQTGLLFTNASEQEVLRCVPQPGQTGGIWLFGLVFC